MLDSCVQNGQSAETYLLDVDATLADIPVVKLSSEQKSRLKSGIAISLEEIDGLYRAKCESLLISLVEVKGNQAKPARNFNL